MRIFKIQKLFNILRRLLKFKQITNNLLLEYLKTYSFISLKNTIITIYHKNKS